MLAEYNILRYMSANAACCTCGALVFALLGRLLRGFVEWGSRRGSRCGFDCPSGSTTRVEQTRAKTEDELVSGID